MPTTAAAQQALFTNDQDYAPQCEAHSGAILPFVGTVDTALDLDRIRQALGDAQLTFIGHSYGTLLGATYAQMFPTHVRAMVLDGAIDPAMSTDQMVIEQAQGFEAVLEALLLLVRLHGVRVARRVRSHGRAARLDRPAAASGPSCRPAADAAPARASSTTPSFGSLYPTSSWPSLATPWRRRPRATARPVVSMSTAT